MRFFRRSLVGLFLSALTLGVLALAVQVVISAVQVRFADSGPAAPARERLFSASVVTVQPGTATPVTTAFGEIRARRTLELRSPRGGTVVHLADGFEDGGAVTAGQLLLQLDAGDATATRDIAQSDLATAGAEQRAAVAAVALARDDLAAAEAQAVLYAQALQRQRDLKTRGAGSPAAVEQAALAASGAAQAVLSRRQALANADARVDQAAAALVRQGITLAEAERALRETALRAEFSGRLSGVNVVAGGILGTNEALGLLIDPDALEVSFRLSTSQYARLLDAGGQLLPASVRVFLDVQGTPIATKGRLTRVGAAVGEGQTGRLVYASLNAARGFRPGDFVTVRIEEPALQGVVVLPGTAVGAQGTVLVVGEGDRLEELPVTILRRQADTVILDAGALAGREVVTARTPLLGAGIRIRPVRGGDAADVPGLVALTPERRAALVADVKADAAMPAEAKARLLDQLAQDQVPAQVIRRLEQPVGG